MKHLHIYCDDFDFAPLAKAFDKEFNSNVDLACEILFVDEEEIQRLNRETRNTDRVTDVLSYPTMDGIKNQKIIKKEHIDEVDEEGNLLIGSIVICTKRAQEQAQEYGHSYNRELHYLATHGVCHLLGFDHMQEDEKAEMRQKEEAVLLKLGITREAE